MWFIGVEVEQETSAPLPKKNPGSAPVTWPRGDTKFLFKCRKILRVKYFFNTRREIVYLQAAM